MFHAEDIIQRLQLQPLPVEGGFYRETYRGAETLAGLVSRNPSAGERSRPPLSTTCCMGVTCRRFTAWSVMRCIISISASRWRCCALSRRN